MDISDNPKQLAEWSELVQELDRVERAVLGVDERGFVHASEGRRGGSAAQNGGRKRANTFLARGLSLFREKEASASSNTDAGNRPRSKSFLQQIFGPIVAPTRRAISHESSEPGDEGTAWDALAPSDKQRQRRWGPQAELDQTRTAPRPTVDPAPAVGTTNVVTSPKPRRLQKKEKQLLAALAAHRRRAGGGSPASPRQGETAKPGAALAGKLHAAPPAHPEVIIPGPAAERLLLSLVRCRAARNSADGAQLASREVGWV